MTTDIIGHYFKNNNNEEYYIVSREGQSKSGNKKYRIRFIRTGYETVVEKVQIERGKIKDRYSPCIFGLGYIGDVSVSRNKRAYNVWHKMLGRCYSPTNNSYNTYGAQGVTVDKRWYSFENFVSDIPLIEGYEESLFLSGELHLDKDKKQQNCNKKIYSKDTCNFISPSENSQLVKKEKYRHSFLAISPEGIEYNHNGIKDFCRIHNLTYQRVRLCLIGEAKTHKGWKFIKM
ncbi:HNH endonuclease [Bacillus phage vB_BanS_Sophrita]|uniref:HNH homing endonuclease n=1 Tax=Bacillus phage vB_BanS_Sophrita TaxID=2894790 RepID=A0AAE8YUB5_9CAUD|nr:HNH endonuclease [Bacillus phage vB_BanS_Sophrita]UGO50737.1 HNH homing endonuclease [Bacillus phage vB_BanS_Sophrita]